MSWFSEEHAKYQLLLPVIIVVPFWICTTFFCDTADCKEVSLLFSVIVAVGAIMSLIWLVLNFKSQK